MFFKVLEHRPHENVLKMLDHFTRVSTENVRYLYLVVEFMSESLLHLWKHQRGFIERSSAVRYLQQICLGVAHLHDCGVVHADLSLANLLIRGDDGCLKIADFGTSACAHACVLKPGEVICSAYVRAPELFLGAEQKLTTSVDLWSVGAVAGSLLTAAHLFLPTDPDATARETFKLQLGFLGPILPEWPEAADLPNFADYAKDAAQEGAASSQTPQAPSAILQDPARVRRPLSVGDHGIPFLLECLRWCPTARSSAETLSKHSFFNERARVPLSELLRTSSKRALEHLVSAAVDAARPLTLSGVTAALTSTTPDTEADTSQTQPTATALSRVSALAPACSQVGQVSDPRSSGAPACSLAGGGDVPADAASDSCACRGNCGNASCKAAQYAQRCRRPQGPLCDQRVAGPGALCDHCRCEAAGCGFPRGFGSSD